MKHYAPKTFEIRDLSGISARNLEEHLKLYQGYVKNANLVIDRIAEYSADAEKYAYELGELQRLGAPLGRKLREGDDGDVTHQRCSE